MLRLRVKDDVLSTAQCTGHTNETFVLQWTQTNLMLDPSTAHLALRPSGPHARIVAAG